MAEPLDAKLAAVNAQLASYQRVLVAFSGGVDSTLLLALARETLGRSRVLAVTADSPSMARADLDEAVRLARLLDVAHRIIATDEIDHASYRENTSDRCFFCKQELFERLKPLLAAEPGAQVLYGAIGDDRLEERPGARAAQAYGVRAPLHEAGLSKAEVRQAARAMELPNWDRPQNACLSSRIPHGIEVTDAKLRQVEQAEARLRRDGFRQVRVRHLGLHARIEVEAEELGRFADAALRERVSAQLREIGFYSAGVCAYRAGGADLAADDELILPLCYNDALP